MEQQPYDSKIYGDLDWFDAPNDVKMSVYIKNRIIPVSEPLHAQLIVYNTGSDAISVITYLDPFDTGKLDSCVKDTMEGIQPGNIGYEIWTFKTEGRAPGDYKIGFFCEPKGAGYYAKGAGRVAMGLLVGIRPGKSVSGFSTKYRIVYGINCPQCGTALVWRRDPRMGWYCSKCDGWL